MPPKWKFLGDDDTFTEFWLNTETGEEHEVEREGPPLCEIPAKDIPQQPIYGPPPDD